MKAKKVPHILAIDHGTSGCKVALISVMGEIVDFQFEATPMHFLPGGGAEQDPEDWWKAAVRATRSLLRRGAAPVSSIEAVCVSSTFSSTVAVDEKGRHLMNSLTWMDSRGAPYVKALLSGFPKVEGYPLFKTLRWVHRTGGGPQLSGKDDIAHVLLVKHEYPRVYEKTFRFLGSKDYLNLRLTGRFAATFDSMTLFWVSDCRKIDCVRYDDGLVSTLGIEREKLPDMCRSIDIIGTLQPSAAAELGLPETVKVVGGSPDHQSALVGSGAVRDFEGHLYIGTSSWVECIVPFKKTDLFHSICSMPSSIPGRYQCINEQDIAGGFLTFLIDNILYRKNELNTGKKPADVFRRLNEVAGRVPAGSNGLIVTPWINGERSPVDSTTLRAGIHNMSVTTAMDDIVRGFFEGVAYNTRWSMGYVEKFVGRKFDALSFIGGGAVSDVWCRIFADVLDRPIKRVKEPMQANARGAAFIASVGLGHITFDDIPGLIRHDGFFEPDRTNRELYDELFDAFVTIYRKNRSMYARLNRAR